MRCWDTSGGGQSGSASPRPCPDPCNPGRVLGEWLKEQALLSDPLLDNPGKGLPGPAGHMPTSWASHLGWAPLSVGLCAASGGSSLDQHGELTESGTEGPRPLSREEPPWTGRTREGAECQGGGEHFRWEKKGRQKL